MPASASQKTHQTTIRFSEELWLELEEAAASLDVSVAQYVREAARLRLAEHEQEAGRESRLAAEAAKERSRDELESSAALWEQGRLARERARLLREQAREWRRPRPFR